MIRWSKSDIHLESVTEAFHRVRQELCDVGLLAEGVYLDEIDLVLSAIPSYREAGFVYDRGIPWLARAAGYEEGVIYLPRNVVQNQYVPGGSLVDTIRHEFAHAWAWLDRPFLNRPWFSRAFGKKYEDVWELGPHLYILFEQFPQEFRTSPYYNNFVTPYALTGPYEDFAETFMMFLRYRRSLARFEKRRGVMRKITAVRDAVENIRQGLEL